MTTVFIVMAWVISATVYLGIGMSVGARFKVRGISECSKYNHSRECFHEGHYLGGLIWPSYIIINAMWRWTMQRSPSSELSAYAKLPRKERQVEERRRAEIAEAEHQLHLARLRAEESRLLDRQLGA